MFAQIEWLPSAFIYGLAIVVVIVARLTGVNLGEVPAPRKRVKRPPPVKASPQKARAEDIELEITDSPPARRRSDEGPPGEDDPEEDSGALVLGGSGEGGKKRKRRMEPP